MTKKLINVTLGESDDPSKLFEKIYRIKNVYETKTNVTADSVWANSFCAFGRS